MRNYKISRNKGEWYNAEVTDKYGNEYQNYFETAFQANEWIHYVWENEEWFNSTNSQDLLANAVAELVKIDEKSNRRAIL